MFAAIIMGIMMNSINVSDGLVVNNHEILSSNDISIVNEYIDSYSIENATLDSFEDTEDGCKFVLHDGVGARYEVNYNDGIELFGKTFFDGFETFKTETTARIQRY